MCVTTNRCLNGIYFPLTPQFLLFLGKRTEGTINDVVFRTVENNGVREINRVILNGAQKAIVSTNKHLGYILWFLGIWNPPRSRRVFLKAGPCPGGSGQFTELSYVRDTWDSFREYYDGERGSIPEEYRVMPLRTMSPKKFRNGTWTLPTIWMFFSESTPYGMSLSTRRNTQRRRKFTKTGWPGASSLWTRS